MKKCIFLFSMFCLWNNLFGQINLVQNPSFEQYSRCPYNYDQIKFANFWSPIDTIDEPALDDTFGWLGCTPEYCNTCCTNPVTGVPINGHFTHYPRTGNGMAQVVMYFNDGVNTYINQRDYLQGTLKNTLIAGKEYCVTFYVTLEQSSAYAINHIGAYFDNGIIDTAQNCGWPQTTHIPQICDSSIINDTLNWVKIQGNFTANGTEKYITMGNFFDDVHTDTLRVYFPLAINVGNSIETLYLIDDVSVIAVGATANAGPGGTTSPTGDSVFIGTNDGYLPCKWYTITGAIIDSNIAGFKVKPAATTKYVMELDVCGVLSRDTVTVWVAPEGIKSINNHEVTLYPNPTTGELNIKTTPGAFQNYTITNSMGSTVLTNAIISTNTQLNIKQLPAGVYYIRLMGDSAVEVRKFVKE